MTKTIIICKKCMEDSENALSSIVTYFRSWYGTMFDVMESRYVTKISYKDKAVHIFIFNCSFASLQGRRCDYYITDDRYPRDYFHWNAEELSIETAKSKIKEILFDRSYVDTDSIDYSSIYPPAVSYKQGTYIDGALIRHNLNSIYGIQVDKEKFYKEYMSMFNTETDIRSKIKKVIFNKPATIVFWTDNTKTVVKCGENDIYEPEKGLAMAISKKMLGNKGNFNEVFKKWLPKED